MLTGDHEIEWHRSRPERLPRIRVPTLAVGEHDIAWHLRARAAWSLCHGWPAVTTCKSQHCTCLSDSFTHPNMKNLMKNLSVNEREKAQNLLNLWCASVAILGWWLRRLWIYRGLPAGRSLQGEWYRFWGQQWRWPRGRAEARGASGPGQGHWAEPPRPKEEEVRFRLGGSCLRHMYPCVYMFSVPCNCLVLVGYKP